MVINAKTSKIIGKKKRTFNIFVKLVKSLGKTNKAKKKKKKKKKRNTLKLFLNLSMISMQTLL